MVMRWNIFVMDAWYKLVFPLQIILICWLQVSFHFKCCIFFLFYWNFFDRKTVHHTLYIIPHAVVRFGCFKSQYTQYSVTETEYELNDGILSISIFLRKNKYYNRNFNWIVSNWKNHWLKKIKIDIWNWYDIRENFD